jgi:hypothetical protein
MADREISMRIPVKTIVTAALVAALGTAIAGGSAYINVPSGLRAGGSVVVSGGGFAGNRSVVLHLKVPAGVEYVTPVMVRSDGSISHSVSLTDPGVYIAEVFDSTGKQLLTSTLIVAGN